MVETIPLVLGNDIDEVAHTGIYKYSMRYSELTEATAQLDKLPKLFYHGCASIELARSILRKGLVPPDLTNVKNTQLRPVEGKVYLTPDIGYALMYAFGMNAVGSDSFKIPYKGNEEQFFRLFNDRSGDRHFGRWGYVFVIDQASLTDIQPDEDSVGELFGFCLRNGPSRYHNAGDHAIWERFTTNIDLMRRFSNFMHNIVTPTQIKKIKDGEYAYYASVGKKALKTMPDDMKHHLCEIGLHVAHTGKLIPTEVWKVDKTKIGYFNKDGSNFRTLAKQIR